MTNKFSLSEKLYVLKVFKLKLLNISNKYKMPLHSKLNCLYYFNKILYIYDDNLGSRIREK